MDNTDELVNLNTLEQSILGGQADAAAADTSSGMKREPDKEATEAEKRLVKTWQDKVLAGKKHWKPDFTRMREDQAFAYGIQWDGQKELNGSKNEGDNAEKYVANITLRHVQQRVAALYAKNPKAVARRREQILHTVWDGTNQSLQTAQTQIQMMQQMMPMLMQQMQAGDMMGAMGSLMSGMQAMPQMQQAQSVLQDAENVRQQSSMLDTIARTLELVQGYTIQEQAHDFKIMMKLLVRRAVTSGVGYVKIGYQRVMQRDPDKEAAIADMTQQLSSMQRRSADLADGKIDENSPEVAALQAQIEVMQSEQDVLVREGVVYDYPNSTAIIPDPKTLNLREFLGADWVAQEYTLSVDEIKEIYDVDVSGSYTGYRKEGDDTTSEVERRMARSDGSMPDDSDCSAALVWEVYSRKEGLVFHICDGYPDFLRKPAAPEVYIERFWPWFPFVPNECDAEGRIFPPSDVRLIRDMQGEINRSRQGIREHRQAARPKTLTASGILSSEDKGKLKDHPNNAIIELDGLAPGQKVDDLLQPFKGPPIDPNLYETNSVYEDSLRVTGMQEANLGGTAGATATESQIAESSRMTSLGSNIDDLDDLLTQLFRASGQILLLEMSEETAKQIAGQGAIWPTMSKSDVAQEIYLEVEAGSTGRPNKAQEIQNAERLVPLLMQIPGIDPEFMARELIKRLDDRIDLSQVFAAQMPSITAMNSMRTIAAGMTPNPAQAPDAQGAQGASNGTQPQRPGGANGPDMVSAPQTPMQNS